MSGLHKEVRQTSSVDAAHRRGAPNCCMLNAGGPVIAAVAGAFMTSSSAIYWALCEHEAQLPSCLTEGVVMSLSGAGLDLRVVDVHCS